MTFLMVLDNLLATHNTEQKNKLLRSMVKEIVITTCDGDIALNVSLMI